MENGVARWLINSRKAAGLAVSDLAAETQLSYTTIYRLERGHTQPTMYSLNLIFSALETPESERLEVYAMVNRPRTLRRIINSKQRAEGADRGGSATVDQGAIIRNMRLRGGLSQDQLAHVLGRTQPTISGWERLKGTPSEDDRNRIVQSLDPNHIEDYMLRTGEVVLAPGVPNRRFLDRCAYDLQRLIDKIEVGNRVHDGEFAVLEARLQILTGRFASAWELLMLAYCWHGEYLIRWSRCSEMDAYARQALQVVKAHTYSDSGMWRAISLMARSLAERNPKRGFEFIRNCPLTMKESTGISQLLRDSAGYASRAGSSEQSNLLMREVRHRANDVASMDAYRAAHADILRAEGSPLRALQVLGDQRPACPFLHIQNIGLRAHILLDLRERREAANQVREHQNWVQTYNFPHLKDGIAGIAARI